MPVRVDENSESQASGPTQAPNSERPAPAEVHGAGQQERRQEPEDVRAQDEGAEQEIHVCKDGPEPSVACYHLRS